jgi:hypothetical protein
MSTGRKFPPARRLRTAPAVPLRDNRMTVIRRIAVIGKTAHVRSENEELAGLLRADAKRIVA